MRLIDADELRDRVGYIEDEYGHINEEINNMPTIDAEPVRHGHWELVYKDNIPFAFKCSECGKFTSHYDYCPSCGAKMDEVDE